MKFRDVVAVLEEQGFFLKRQSGTSHRVYQGTVAGKVQVVVLAFSHLGEDVPPGTLASIIRQSGLPRKLFRSEKRHKTR